MNWLKTYFAEVIVKEYGPSAIRAAILGAVGWLIAKNGVLSHYGVISDAVSQTTVIHWDQLSKAAIAGIPAVIAVGIKFFQHHTVAAVTGAPQSGDKRDTSNAPDAAGQRSTDVPK